MSETLPEEMKNTADGLKGQQEAAGGASEAIKEEARVLLRALDSLQGDFIAWKAVSGTDQKNQDLQFAIKEGLELYEQIRLVLNEILDSESTDDSDQSDNQDRIRVAKADLAVLKIVHEGVELQMSTMLYSVNDDVASQASEAVSAPAAPSVSENGRQSEADIMFLITTARVDLETGRQEVDQALAGFDKHQFDESKTIHRELADVYNLAVGCLKYLTESGRQYTADEERELLTQLGNYVKIFNARKAELIALAASPAISEEPTRAVSEWPVVVAKSSEQLARSEVVPVDSGNPEAIAVAEQVITAEEWQEQTRLKDLFRRMQNGDPALFSKESLFRNLGILKRDLASMLDLAGYSNAEFEQIFDTRLYAILDAVAAERRKKDAKKADFASLSNRLMSTMAELLRGREIDPEVLVRLTVDTKRSSAGSETQGVEDATPTEETVNSQEEAGADFERLKTAYENEAARFEDIQQKIKALNLPWLAQLVNEKTSRISSALKRIEALLADQVTDPKVGIEKIKLNLELVSRLCTELEADSRHALPVLEDEVYVKGDPVDIDLGTLTPPEPTPPPEPLDIDLDTLTPPGSSKEHTELNTYQAAKTKLNNLRDGEVWQNPDGTTERVGGFRAAKKAYDEALKKYYEERGIIDKAKNVLAKTFLGREAALPPELLQQQAAYREKRQAYAEALKVALTERGQARTDNKDFSLEAPEAQRAFGRKFILKPRAETLAMKAEVTLSKERSVIMQNIMNFVRNNPRGMKVFGLTTAVGLGAFTGGLAGGGIAFTRFMAATTVGAALSGMVYKRLQSEVDQAELQRQVSEGAVGQNFSLETLNALEEQLLNADAKSEVTKTRQTAGAAITGAGFGFATGFGLSETFNTPSAPTSESGDSAAAPEAAASSPEEPMTASPLPGDAGGAAVETPRVPSEVYAVRPGDNLSTILHRNLVAQFESGKLILPEGMTKADISRLMYEKFPELSDTSGQKSTLSPGQWKMLGVESGDPQSLRVGDAVIVGALIEKFADSNVQIVASGEVVEQPIRRPGTGPLPIKDVGGFEQMIKIKQDIAWSPTDGPQQLDYINNSDAAGVGVVDPMYNLPKSALPENLTLAERLHVGELNKPNLTQSELLAAHALTKPPAFIGGTENYLQSLDYQKYLAQNGFTNPDVVKTIVDKAALNFEGKTYNLFNELAQTFDSPFKGLSHLSLKEITEIKNQAGNSTETLRTLLEGKAAEKSGMPVTYNIPTMKAWLSWLETTQAQENVSFTEKTTLGDLFSRATLEKAIQDKFEAKYAAKLK